MPSSVDFSGRPFHFIGIGGIGMSALAYILAKRKLPVYGSDIKSSHITERLQEMGAHIFWRQDASNFEVFQTGLNDRSPRAGIAGKGYILGSRWDGMDFRRDSRSSQIERQRFQCPSNWGIASSSMFYGNSPGKCRISSCFRFGLSDFSSIGRIGSLNSRLPKYRRSRDSRQNYY